MSTQLIIGGTGKVGARLAAVLAAQGHSPQVASRTGGDVHFDWRDASTYRPALRGVDAVFIVGPGSATDWSPQLAELLSVASDEAVRKAVLLSARGVEFLPDGAVARAERVLQDGDVAWTILRPSHFAQNFTEAMFVPVSGRVLVPASDGAEPFVDVEDLAEVAAAVLTTDGWDHAIIAISGPAALTFENAVHLLGEAAGERYEYVDDPPEHHLERLRSAGTPEGYITWRMAMLGGIRSGHDAYVSTGVTQVLGRPATSFQDWLAREATSTGTR
jgi:uncharacterized protein YbjT (DUF2867 family)